MKLYTEKLELLIKHNQTFYTVGFEHLDEIFNYKVFVHTVGKNYKLYNFEKRDRHPTKKDAILFLHKYLNDLTNAKNDTSKNDDSAIKTRNRILREYPKSFTK